MQLTDLRAGDDRREPGRRRADMVSCWDDLRSDLQRAGRQRQHHRQRQREKQLLRQEISDPRT